MASTSATGRHRPTFVEQLDRLCEPLTELQEKRLRDAFPRGSRSKAEAQQLIDDWDLIREAMERRALDMLRKQGVPKPPKVVRDREKRRSTELAIAVAAADIALDSIALFFELWDRHRGNAFDVSGPADRAWGARVTGELRRKRATVQALRATPTVSQRWPAKQGRQRTPARALQEVLAEYFTGHGWTISTDKNGLFTVVAGIICRTQSVNAYWLMELRNRSKHDPT